MKYSKPSLTFDQQADLLINRGLVVTDKKTLLIHHQNHHEQFSECRMKGAND